MVSVDQIKDVVTCSICNDTVGGVIVEGDYSRWECPECRQKYPMPIRKANSDMFHYALGLRNGSVFQFDSCTIRGDWVHLDAVTTDSPDLPFDRGVYVRVEDIVWCADAPYGS
jgi:hypothetical protein